MNIWVGRVVAMTQRKYFGFQSVEIHGGGAWIGIVGHI